jgi:hypothetical protein
MRAERASQLIAREWVEPGGAAHQMFHAVSDSTAAVSTATGGRRFMLPASVDHGASEDGGGALGRIAGTEWLLSAGRPG